MSNVRVYNLKKEYEPLLAFLFPDYAIVESGAVTRKFITHRNITSSSQRDALNCYYDDCIFISTQIFDEFLDETKLKEMCVEYSRKNLRNRKTKLEAQPETFVEDCVSFMYDVTSDDEEASINELFEAFGSQSFLKVFLDKSLSIAPAKLAAAMNTFIFKILSVSEASSIFYKKKAAVYAPKIRANLMKATDEFLLRDQDIFGLSVAKFYADLAL